MGIYESKTNIRNKVSEPDLNGTYTAADYRSWNFDGFMELIRGKIFKMSPAPSTLHQKISSNLTYFFSRQFFKTPCQFFTAPTDVYLIKKDADYRNAENIVQPDLLVICDHSKIKSFGCVGAPDLIVEIISPNTTKKDLKLKYALYEEYGVKEYWTVYPSEKILHIYSLDNGKYNAPVIYTSDEEAVSILFPELQIPLQDVFI